MAQLATSRLLLRQWCPEDRAPFAALNADPEVMRYFPAAFAREQSDALADHLEETIARQGWGLWAVEIVDGEGLIGFVCLNRPRFHSHFTPAIEVGWRLRRPHWGHGYAGEAGTAAPSFGLGELRCAEIVSFTAVVNDPWRWA